ncbi:hypothetical protein WICPIJ_007336 [Wickerhamomyces pijperi]|uniref:Eukaryotic translation initiation factor 3 subunit G n=1 Tax=Wickerhamomyces pijperi TaxID=599730 RepID=A0A9P8TK12_WICPI|nr:hypothetical protein WICPIJ_007336 [Wickerhamomyces pijperi]
MILTRVKSHHRPVVWAEDQDQQQPETITNADGTKTIISYKTNEQGKKVKVTQKIKLVVVKESVNKNVASRKKWAKFGSERGNAPGPDYRTTQIGDVVTLRLSTDWKKTEAAAEEEKKSEAAKAKSYSGIKCRTCGGAHYTAKCPFKDTLGSVDPAAANAEAEGIAAAEAAVASGKYVPVHMRGQDGGIASEQERRDRDDACTVKITQLNENVDEFMLRQELLARWPIVRCTLVKNRETGRSKGLAYVQFQSEEAAQNAIERLDGQGYQNLIIHVEWSKPKKNNV